MFVVFDMDGTLSDDSHRAYFLDNDAGPPDWAGYNAACNDDVPIKPIIEICNSLIEQGNMVNIWTGRLESMRDDTRQWLRDHGVFYHQLCMRPDGDFRSSTVVKEELMEQHGKPDLMFEDRTDHVARFRSLGITVCQVAQHDY